MTSEVFQKLLDELDGNSLQTLKEKNARYSAGGDCLHNFRSGANVAGGTPAQACWGYMTKHLVALRDMIERNDFSNREDFLEKCQDTINYVRFLWCIGNDENPESTKETKYRINEWFESRNIAELFIDKIERTFSKYGVLSMADIKGLLGMDETILPEDHNFGWKSIEGITYDKSIHYDRNIHRYYILVPNPVEI